MKKACIATLLLVMVIMPGISCGAPEFSVMEPAKKVSLEIKDKINTQGMLTESIALKDKDELFSLNIYAGTEVFNKDYDPLETITIEPPDDTPEPPTGGMNISVADFGPDGAIFTKPVEITLSYDPETIPAGMNPNDLAISFYDEENEKWVELTNITVDSENHTVTGETTHFTLFAIQIRGTELGIPPVEPEDEPYYLPNTLSLRFQDMLGTKVWVLGYYGDSSFATDEVAFLIDDYSRLLNRRQLPQHTFARLDGNLPPEQLDGKIVMVYGEVKEYGKEHNAFVIFPTPLITIEEYVVFEGSPDFQSEDKPFYSLVSNVFDSVMIQNLTLAHSAAYYSPHQHLVSSDIAEEVRTWLQTSEQVAAQVVANKARDCDRVLVIAGGVDANNNSPAYAFNTKERFKKLKELGFSKDQIDIFQYDGTAINVDGKNVVDGPATIENVKAAIKKYLEDMPSSCTLLVFVDDHGTGYDPSEPWDGERPVLDIGAETGATYDESSFKVDLRRYVFRATRVVRSGSGDKWILTKYTSSGRIEIYRKEGDSYVYAGWDKNGNGWITEDEVNTGKINNNDTLNEDNAGFEFSDFEDTLKAPIGDDKSWDTDGDGNADVRARWVDPGRYHLERKVGAEWKKMGEDTSGDFIIDATDGGVNWDLSNDGAKNKVGFHEGINMLGKEVLWDNQFAELLKPLSDKEIHILVEMQQCFSGGFINNLEGIVEKICTVAPEEKTASNFLTDASTKASTGLKYMDYYHQEFIKNLGGIDIPSWNKAHQAAVKGDTARAKALGVTPNEYQLWEQPEFKSKTAFSESNGTYYLSFQTPEGGPAIYDFEIIYGLQTPQWTTEVNFEELPEGLKAEKIPGGIRVYRDSPLSGEPWFFKFKGQPGAKSLFIKLTDEDHKTVGVMTPQVGEIPESYPMTLTISPKCEAELDNVDCSCVATVTIEAEANDPNEKCKIYLAEVYVDGQLVNRMRMTEDDPDKSHKASTKWSGSYKQGVSCGEHVAVLRIKNQYGHVTKKEVEFSCGDDISMIPAKEAADRIKLPVYAKVAIQGYEPDCTATMKVTWMAESIDKDLHLRAAWLRIDGSIVASSTHYWQPYNKPDTRNIPDVFESWQSRLFTGPTPDTIPLPADAKGDPALGGEYICPVQPDSTVLIEVIALGEDCQYYIIAREKTISPCPEDTGGGSTDDGGGG